MIRIVLTMGFLLALSPLAAFAQPSAFAYQGRLDLAGQPANGVFIFTFTLFDSASDEGVIGKPITLAATVTDGLFTSLLNAGGEFGPNAFDGSNRWLQIDVNGTPLTPRQPIAASPYALAARTVLGPVDVRVDLAAPAAVVTAINKGTGRGVIGSSPRDTGVLGEGLTGVTGYSPIGFGIIGITDGMTEGAAAVRGDFGSGFAARTGFLGADRAAVWGQAATGLAGQFDGPVYVDGNLGINVPSPTVALDVGAGNVQFGNQTDEYPDDASVPQFVSYKKNRFKPWRQADFGLVTNGMLDLDARGAEGGLFIQRWYAQTGAFLSNGPAAYIDAGGHYWTGIAISAVGRHNGVNTEDGFAYAGAFYEADGTTALQSMIEIHADINNPALIINAGPLALTNNYPLLVGYSNTMNSSAHRDADFATFAMENDGGMFWNAGHTVASYTRPSADANFDTTLKRVSAGALAVNAGSVPGAVRLGGKLATVSTSIGNLGPSGPDDLQTYTLPANALASDGMTLRVKCWGTTANNPNPKTVAFVFGTTTILQKQLVPGVAGTWSIKATIVRTGTNAQDVFCEAQNYNATSLGSTDGPTILKQAAFRTTGQATSAPIVIKCQSTESSTNNDIVQEGMLVEFLN